MYEFLKKVREYELELALKYFPDKGKMLEIGAGAGWQAKTIATFGYEVEAIDVQDSRYNDVREWPVTIYDGCKIPFPDNYFDIIYSSNVLEHIESIVAFQLEMQRVLKDSGVAIHILPSAAWRFWSIVTFYPYIFLTGIKYITNHVLRNRPTQSSNYEKLNKLSKINLLKIILFPARHGERGNMFSELIYFSKSSWERLFRNTGWIVRSIIPCNIMYSGNSIFGTRISIEKRIFLSRFLRSSSYIYILHKQ